MRLGYVISRAANFFKKRCALVCDGKDRTYAEIDENSNSVANGLINLGLEKGDRVALVSHNCVEYLETDIALYKSGLIRVAVNPMLSPPEIAHIIKDSGAKTVFLSSSLADLVLPLKGQLDQVKNYVFFSGSNPDVIEYSSLLDNSKNFTCPWVIEENDIAMLFYTGGTTGVPKGAIHTHESISTVLNNLQAEFWHMKQSDVFLSGGSLAHANGFRAMVSFLQGAKFIIPAHFEPKAILETIQREKVTILSTVPTTLIRLCNCEGIHQYDLKSLRLITYGAAPMPMDRLKNAIRLFGNCFSQSYGQAEALMSISVLNIDDHVIGGSENEFDRLASAGRPYMNNEVKIVDEKENELACGEVGEVTVRSKIVMKGYWQNPEATAEALKDGWIHTGDLGRMDEDGFLFLVDRKKDMIISGGYNIYAREVEDVIHEHPAVLEAAVIGVPDENWGEAVKAIVVLRPGKTATEEEIIAFTKKRMASFKKPKSIEFMKSFPLTAAGKIAKKDLRAPFWIGHKRSIH
ncbi:long-chain-fatty-acid--CoA ligase [uncultured Desulfosarcina sp.]|uniref:long-chain-fatty-acid--CoA ligase n=1 Tax=uncultured Desulfosarcina sp. TaxID=218289 RepID=UPI0029C7A15D|nr:long-chain-fatty-acid--CoA ligase [uncultured Desulfosarcina sp.]